MQIFVDEAHIRIISKDLIVLKKSEGINFIILTRQSS